MLKKKREHHVLPPFRVLPVPAQDLLSELLGDCRDLGLKAALGLKEHFDLTGRVRLYGRQQEAVEHLPLRLGIKAQVKHIAGIHTDQMRRTFDTAGYDRVGVRHEAAFRVLRTDLDL